MSEAKAAGADQVQDASAASAGPGIDLERLECTDEIGVLIVDDEQPICDMLRQALKHKKFRLRTVSDMSLLESAIKEGGPYHLILLDFVLPGVNTGEVLNWIQQLHANALLVVMTGQPSVEAAQYAIRARAIDYILKPFDLAELRKALLTGLRRKGLLRVSDEALREAVGAVVRERRRAADLTLVDLARRADISVGFLSQIELGKNSPSVDTLYRLCLVLKIRMSDIFVEIERAIRVAGDRA